MTRESIKNIINDLIQPLMRGSVKKTDGLKTTVGDLIPEGSGDFQQASNFGFSSNPPSGVLAYFLNLFGKAQNPIVLSHLHKERPTAGGPGATLVYSTDVAGKAFPVKIYLLPDGTIRIEATSKMKVVCDNIELGDGSLEKILNGETFQQYINEHFHIDSIGGTTQPPFVQSTPDHLSSVVKAKK